MSVIKFGIALINNIYRTKKYLIISLAIVLFFWIFIKSDVYTSLISPLASDSFQYMQFAKKNREVFSFAPGLAQNKFDSIDFKGLNTLAFFDLPVTEEGDIYDGYGYSSFKSEESQILFQQAHSAGTKVVVALTQTDDREIEAFLSSEDAQNNLISQAILEVKDSGIDGASVDFEYKGKLSSYYKEKYTKFISNLASSMHREIPNSLVTVAISSNNPSDLDISGLSKVADKIFVIASDTIAPEEKNSKPAVPVFGYNAGDYWDELSKRFATFMKRMPEDKVVFERAWYGNGDNYPLYQPSAKADVSVNVANNTKIDSGVKSRLISGVPDEAKSAAKKNLPYIIAALKKEGILNSSVLSYALATIEHETAGTFEPISEYSGRMSSRRLGYEGGENYFGRGFIQLTHLRNYRIMGQRIGLGDKLAKNPELASQPKIAAEILAAFFKDNNIATLAANGDFIDARRPVNPDRNGYEIALLAWKYEDSF